MRNRPFLIFVGILLFFSVSSLSAQQRSNGGKAIIKGQIIDADSSSPLDYATITLFNNADSSMVTGSITDESGTFTIEAAPGAYYAMVEFISYKN